MFNKIQLTVFTLLVFVCCVVIFPIHCECLQWKLGVIDLNLLPEFPYKSFIFTAILNYSTWNYMCRSSWHVLMIKLTHWAWAACDWIRTHEGERNNCFSNCRVLFTTRQTSKHLILPMLSVSNWFQTPFKIARSEMVRWIENARTGK